jgi:histone demethylase JARID1
MHKNLRHSMTCCLLAALLPHRLVQEPGSFVVVLPNAYHSWFSTGFSIHESVALAPWDCLGGGADAERSCRQQHAPTALSHTELLVTLVSPP